MSPEVWMMLVTGVCSSKVAQGWRRDWAGTCCWGRRVWSCPQSSSKDLGVDFTGLHVGKGLGQKWCGLGRGRCWALRISLHGCCCEVPCNPPGSPSTVLLSGGGPRSLQVESHRREKSSNKCKLCPACTTLPVRSCLGGTKMPAAACRRWAELGENQKQGRGRRMEKIRVGIKGREVAGSFNTAGLGEDWFQTGRPGSRDLSCSAGEHSPREALPARLGSRDERSLVNKGGEAGTQAMHGLEPVCSLQLWPVIKIISLRCAGIAHSIIRCLIAPLTAYSTAAFQCQGRSPGCSLLHFVGIAGFLRKYFQVNQSHMWYSKSLPA